MAKAYWSDKWVVISGGSSGIGLALAKQLAVAGAHLWLIARGEDRLQLALREVQLRAQSPSQQFGYTAADLTEAKQAEAVAERVLEKAGRVDVLINSVGAAHPGYIQELTLDIFHWMMAANYFAPLYLIKALLPTMIAQGGGQIINIASAAALVGVFGYSAYGAAKYALVGFSEVLRAEMKPHRIRVSVVYPPDTETPQLEYENRFKPPETKAISGTAAPLSPDQVARAILKQAAQGTFAIFPSWDVRVIAWLVRLFPQSLVFAALDALARKGKQAGG
ncbi:MAG: SDR family oxidoreductase [Anaerolineales bacterium]|nr:SDR family oxidoreductase [Anaerolineales bacterium]MCS7247384.1 SDR family oxidoreductase [Anaerolineales bacterium]MDW8161195.1 SDR family oxidoreductase [Anaerolineales bacterium]MDW8446274.1 SDR family oxidoreductase [Anaerolineales bacterium]